VCSDEIAIHFAEPSVCYFERCWQNQNLQKPPSLKEKKSSVRAIVMVSDSHA